MSAAHCERCQRPLLAGHTESLCPMCKQEMLGLRGSVEQVPRRQEYSESFRHDSPSITRDSTDDSMLRSRKSRKRALNVVGVVIIAVLLLLILAILSVHPGDSVGSGQAAPGPVPNSK